MRYLIILKAGKPYYTNWYTADNHWNGDEMLMVVDLAEDKHTLNGIDWDYIEEDHL